MVFFNSSVSEEDLTLFFFFSFGESADFLVSHTYTARWFSKEVGFMLLPCKSLAQIKWVTRRVRAPTCMQEELK